MEIRSASLLNPLLPDPAGRTSARRPPEPLEKAVIHTGTGLAERIYQGDLVAGEEASDYGELIRRARFQSAGGGRFEAAPDTPFRARQALSAYGSNTAPPDVELMPRIDDFV